MQGCTSLYNVQPCYNFQQPSSSLLTVTISWLQQPHNNLATTLQQPCNNLVTTVLTTFWQPSCNLVNEVVTTKYMLVFSIWATMSIYLVSNKQSISSLSHLGGAPSIRWCCNHKNHCFMIEIVNPFLKLWIHPCYLSEQRKCGQNNSLFPAVISCTWMHNSTAITVFGNCFDMNTCYHIHSVL